jgi:release factor glutamine methyltransferase
MTSFAVHLTTDISSSATLCTAATATLNKTPLDPIRTDLLASLLPRLRHSVDVLVFNPPYVETNDDEVVYAQGEGRGGIEGAWAGGESGMVVTERVLELVEVCRILSRQKGD